MGCGGSKNDGPVAVPGQLVEGEIEVHGGGSSSGGKVEGGGDGTPPSGVWKGEFTSRHVGRGLNQYELQFEDGGTVTATEKNQYLQQSGRGSWTRDGASIMTLVCS